MSSGPRGRGPRGGASGARGARGGATSSHVAGSIRGPPTSASSTPTPSHTSRSSTPAGGSAAALLSRGVRAGDSAGPSTPRPSGPGAASGAATSSYSGANSGVIGINDKSGRIATLVLPTDKCPNCKTDRFLNPKLQLLVSPCYHKLCTSCIDRIWSLGPAPCPECGHVCRKSQFGSQTFSDLGVEREVDIRKRIAKLFAAKSQEDFDTLKAYNDYLEEAELITFNLVNRVDVEETNAKVAKHEAELAAHNRRNRGDNASSSAQASEALAMFDARMAALRQARIARRRAQEVEDLKMKSAKEDELVTALEDGLDEDALDAIQDKWKRKQEEIEAQREMEELEEVRKEQESRDRGAFLQEGSHSKGVAKASSTQSGPPWRSESLMLFTGPVAPLSSGRELLACRAAACKTDLDDITGGTDQPDILAPKQLDITSNDASRAEGWTPYDPWLEPFLEHIAQPAQSDERARFRAGGYDIAGYWEYQMGACVGSLSLRPPPVATSQTNA